MNVLSLFDGMSCGRIALERAGIKVDNYYSSEIDKYAIKVADKNYPQDSNKRLGSVIDLDEEYLKSLNIDMIIGGSPCQGFSVSGKLKGSATKCGVDITSLEQYLELKAQNFEFDGQSYLFWEFVRVWKAVQPKYFFLENVRVTKKWLPMFNEAMGVEPIMINSSLVSAQNRVRFYWTNIPNVSQPKDRGIVLRDVLEDGVADIVINQGKEVYKHNPDKSHCLMARDWKGFGNQGMTGVRPCELREFNEDSTCHHIADATDINGNESIKRVYADSGKSPTLTTMQGGHRQPKVLIHDSVKPSVARNIEINHEDIMKSNKDFYDMRATSGFQDNKIGLKKSVTLRAGNDCAYVYDKPTYRKLTPIECERLQTVPDNYTDCVSNSQRYKMLGNGWTIDVIAHVFKGLQDEFI